MPVGRHPSTPVLNAALWAASRQYSHIWSNLTVVPAIWPHGPCPCTEKLCPCRINLILMYLIIPAPCKVLVDQIFYFVEMTTCPSNFLLSIENIKHGQSVWVLFRRLLDLWHWSYYKQSMHNAQCGID